MQWPNSSNIIAWHYSELKWSCDDDEYELTLWITPDLTRRHAVKIEQSLDEALPAVLPGATADCRANRQLKIRSPEFTAIDPVDIRNTVELHVRESYNVVEALIEHDETSGTEWLTTLRELGEGEAD